MVVIRVRMMVFSAHAEVVPTTNNITVTLLGILRARGGSSST